MKNPVQKMLKAASQMKNNPQLAQREAQSPNKVNAIAAQMVIPEQQAMQNSKPIPHPVGSVLMQKLAQAQQAAMAAKMPQPSEGGIAQMAAKGGVLKYVGGGYTGTMADVKKVRNKARAEYQAQPTRKEQIAKATEVTPTKLGDLPGMEEFQTEAKAGIARDIESQNKAAAAAARAKTKSQKVSQAKTAKMAANFETAVENMGPKPKPKPKVGRKVKEAKAPAPTNTAEQLIAELGSPYEEAKAARETREAYDAEANRRAGEATARANVRKLVEQGQTPAARIPQGRRSIGRGAAPDYRAQGIEQAVRATNVPGPKQVAEGQAAEAESTRKATRAANREAAANALKTQEGRNKPKPKLDGTPRVTAESRRQQADILRENNKKSSIIGDKGQVVPRQPETPEQKAEWDKAAAARKARRAKVSSELGLPEKGGIASAASKEAREYMAGKKQSAEPPAEEKLPSKKKTADVTQGEATARLEKAKAEGVKARNAQSPATVHADVDSVVRSVASEHPGTEAGMASIAQEVRAANPDATPTQIGLEVAKRTPPEIWQKFQSRVSPILDKVGVSHMLSDKGIVGKYGPGLMKKAQVVGAADALGDIYDVYSDPTKTKGDVLNQAFGSAVRGLGAGVGGSAGAGLGAFAGGVGAVPGGIAGGIGGYEAADYGVKKLRSTFGLPEEDPSATSHGGYHKALQGISDATASPVSYIKAGESQAIDLGVLNERRKAAGLPPVTQQQLSDIRKERMGTAAAQSEPPATPSDSASKGQAPQGQAPQGQAPQGQAPQGQAPQGQAPQGQAPQGQAPQGRAPAGQTVGYQPSASGAAAPSAPQAPRTETQATQDQYAGDTSEGTPEGAVRELMKLRGPGYSYSPEVMGMLKDARDEDRQATALSMLAGIGAGLANRDRYAGAHDAALLANQAFTSGREREDAAQQRFLQGIIHNEQVPFEQRQAAYEMYTKMQMAAAQNEALYGRALLSSDARRYAANMGYAGKALAGQRDFETESRIKSLNSQLASWTKMLTNDPTNETALSNVKRIQQELDSYSGLAGDQGLGQTTPITTLKM